ncbi:hypothetical protein TrLO_g15466 [Triparma laevis f. longispina]|uniref:NIF system FeS cluster assembly NifU C-terminal domain-containing protein n=1 Tax=Triparma laevis f. longispina TaxID=1714387 RepID=A0A9W7F5S3_9STRA|nr:hypothetical protein TrLO_g15466 [Triparma laevis f. longispina]
MKQFSFALALLLVRASSFMPTFGPKRPITALKTFSEIESPFADGGGASASEADNLGPAETFEGPLDLTLDNVEAVLDEMRPYLISDGGNVKVTEIDGPIVRLELVGECGTCPSSTQTMKMGLERKLKEKIPEISEVVQAIPEGPSLEIEQVDVVLESVRPFLAVAGGSIVCEDIVGVGSTQPTVMLKMEGASATLQSVKLEITQRIQRHFMSPGLRVTWTN